jgi:hypothetical protein
MLRLGAIAALEQACAPDFASAREGSQGRPREAEEGVQEWLAEESATKQAALREKAAAVGSV